VEAAQTLRWRVARDADDIDGADAGGMEPHGWSRKRMDGADRGDGRRLRGGAAGQGKVPGHVPLIY